MSNPRFEPRRSSLEPDSFGRSEVIAWKNSPSPSAIDRLETARLQHAYAVVIRRRARSKFKTVGVYAQTCGVSYDRMAKILRGEAIMRLEDIAQAHRILGGIHQDAMKLLSQVNRRMGIDSAEQISNAQNSES